MHHRSAHAANASMDRNDQTHRRVYFVTIWTRAVAVLCMRERFTERNKITISIAYTNCEYPHSHDQWHAPMRWCRSEFIFRRWSDASYARTVMRMCMAQCIVKSMKILQILRRLDSKGDETRFQRHTAAFDCSIVCFSSLLLYDIFVHKMSRAILQGYRMGKIW